MAERRFGPRIYVPYKGRLRGIDTKGQQFKEDTVLSNLSAGGLYLRLSRRVVEGTKVSVAVRLSLDPPEETPAVHLAARGVVLRVQPELDGRWGIAVEFTQKRIF